MEKINIENLKIFEIKSISFGELHAGYVAIEVPYKHDETLCRHEIEEKYYRFHIETDVAKGYLFIDIKNQKRRIERQFIAWYEKGYDPLIPDLKEGLTKGSFSTQMNKIMHLPLLLIPGDIIFISMFAKQPFKAYIKREW